MRENFELQNPKNKNLGAYWKKKKKKKKKKKVWQQNRKKQTIETTWMMIPPLLIITMATGMKERGLLDCRIATELEKDLGYN